MTDDSWTEKLRTLSAAGLLVQASSRNHIEKLSDIESLIEAANSSGITLLNDQTMSELLSIISQKSVIQEKKSIKLTQKTFNVEGNGKIFGRQLAPINENEHMENITQGTISNTQLETLSLDASEITSDIQINFDVTGNSITEGKMKDITSYFSSRLKQIRDMMISHNSLPRLPIRNSDAWRGRNRYNSQEYEITLVGLASEVKWTRTGKLKFTVEDDTSQIDCILPIPSDAESTHPSLDGLMDDEIVGVSGFFISGGRDAPLFVTNIHKPPLGLHSKKSAGLQNAVCAAFLSDIHLGSKTFLSKQWDKMIHWFNTDDLARKIKYFVLSGDGVDGVGIYPGQEKHLSITDLYKQYSELGRMLEELPEWVEVIMLPGNHDAVRPAEPQPSLDPEIQQDYSNTTFVGNPCDFSLHGVRVLGYHGKSIDDFVATLRSVSYSKPEMAMRAMLERRHLAPSWGGKTPISPEPEDRMVIPEIPDIFVTGHVHGHVVEDYKGTLMVHSSTWQDQTDFQMMLGFKPKPCILTIVNLNSFSTSSIQF